MADIVVTVPKRLWAGWIEEGDCPGERWSGQLYEFCVGGFRPPIDPGERVYIVAHGRLRGYALLVRLEHAGPYSWALVRGGGATDCTIGQPIRGFRGWQQRWWDRSEERPFPDWRTAGVPGEAPRQQAALPL